MIIIINVFVKSKGHISVNVFRKRFIKSKYLYAIFLLPLLYYIVFCYTPMYGITIAFKNFNVVDGITGSPWIGFKHFKEYLSDDYFWKLVRNNLLIGVYSILWGFPVPIILALLLNEVKNQKFKRITQTLSYLPHFISTVVVCGMLVNFLNSDGIANQIIDYFGHKPVQFLMSPKYFRTIYISSGIWQGAGWGTIVYLAALSGVDAELYEASVIDGANRWKQLIHITLPGIAPTISIMLILALGGVMGIGFEKILLLQSPSTYETSDVLATYVYRRGLIGNEFGYSTAVGLFQSVINLIFLVSANVLSKKISNYGLW